MIEQQPVLATPGKDMQGKADRPQERLASSKAAQFLAVQEALGDQFVQRLGILCNIARSLYGVFIRKNGLSIMPRFGSRSSKGLSIVLL